MADLPDEVIIRIRHLRQPLGVSAGRCNVTVHGADTEARGLMRPDLVVFTPKAVERALLGGHVRLGRLATSGFIRRDTALGATAWAKGRVQGGVLRRGALRGLTMLCRFKIAPTVSVTGHGPCGSRRCRYEWMVTGPRSGWRILRPRIAAMTLSGTRWSWVWRARLRSAKPLRPSALKRLIHLWPVLGAMPERRHSALTPNSWAQPSVDKTFACFHVTGLLPRHRL